MNGKEIAAEHKGKRPDKGTHITPLQRFYEKVSKDPGQEKMKNNDQIKAKIEWKQQKQNIWRVKNTRLKGGEQRLTTIKIGVPERKLASFYHTYPQRSRGYEENGQIPLNKKRSTP